MEVEEEITEMSGDLSELASGSTSSGSSSSSSSSSSALSAPLISNRYSKEDSRARVKKYVEDYLQYQVAQGIAQKNPRNFIKGLAATASLPQSRLIGAQFLEGCFITFLLFSINSTPITNQQLVSLLIEWLNNASLGRYAKEYLQRLCVECYDTTDHDMDTLKWILKIKVPTFHCNIIAFLLEQ
jgi:hypothetical protein